MKCCIVIPARYGSTRLPRKPLIKLAGKTMLSRVVEVAKRGASGRDDIEIVVATDDERITHHCQEIGVQAVMTPKECQTGSDRTLSALESFTGTYDFVLNLQGDAPMTPPHFVTALLDAFEKTPHLEMVTAVVPLSWSALDRLRESKKRAPFSGTCAIVHEERALWFSKSIVPSIREEKSLRQNSDISPVYQHVGLYGYSPLFLKQYVSWPQSHYEKLEGLEQLRAIENGHAIHTVTVSYDSYPPSSGVDSPEDVKRVEALFKEHGELYD